MSGQAAMVSARDILAGAAWLTGARAKAYGRMLLAANVIFIVVWLVLSRGGLDPSGRALGTDFTSFWAASKLALAGRPADAYVLAAHASAQHDIFGTAIGYSAFFYPPTYLLVCLPLALMPYLAALLVWLVATAYACARALRPWLGRDVWLLAAFPATFTTIGHGQNAFLTTALFASGVGMMASRPILAGACFGLLTFKPHLGVLIPVALLAARRWTVIASAAATTLALVGMSALLFGIESWQGFLANAPQARAALEDNLVGFHKMQSTFAALRLIGFDLTLAYVAQALVAGAVAVAIGVVAWQHREHPALPALMATGACLASPFLLDYDLMLLALPLAWLYAEGQRSGFLAFEKTVMAAVFVLPLVARPIAGSIGLPLTPLLVAALFVVVLQRAGFFARTTSKAAELPAAA